MTAVLAAVGIRLTVLHGPALIALPVPRLPRARVAAGILGAPLFPPCCCSPRVHQAAEFPEHRIGF